MPHRPLQYEITVTENEGFGLDRATPQVHFPKLGCRPPRGTLVPLMITHNSDYDSDSSSDCFLRSQKGVAPLTGNVTSGYNRNFGVTINSVDFGVALSLNLCSPLISYVTLGVHFTSGLPFW